VSRVSRRRDCVLIGLAVFCLYAARLAYSPAYLHHDEVFFALQAHAIASTAHDVRGRLLPIYFQVSDEVWFQPAAVYLTALFLKILPLSEWSVRLPSVVIGTADVVLMYLIASRLFADRRWAIIAALLLTFTPAHFVHSRIAMDYLYPVPFVMAWLLCLLMFLERPRPWVLFAATSCLGLGFYSYIASVVMMPMYLVLTWIALWWTHADRRSHGIAAVGFSWPLLLLVPWLLYHRDVLTATAGRYELSNLPTLSVTPARTSADSASAAGPSGILQQLRRSTHFSGVTGRVSLYWYFFDPAYLFLTGGYANVVNSTRFVGAFPAPFAVLLPLGLVVVATRWRRISDALLVAGFVTAPFAACLVVPEPYAIDRELEVLPFGVLLATIGAQRLVSSERWRTRTIGWSLLALVPLHFMFLCFVYFTDYRVRSAFWFDSNRRGALEQIIAREPRDRAVPVYLSIDIPYIDWYWNLYLAKHGRGDLLARTVYFEPGALNLSSVSPGTLLLISRQDARGEALLSSGAVRQLTTISEPGDPPFFSVLER